MQRGRTASLRGNPSICLRRIRRLWSGNPQTGQNWKIEVMYGLPTIPPEHAELSLLVPPAQGTDGRSF